MSKKAKAAIASEISLPGPNFLGIGVARSGTTTVYKVLKNHPDIFMPEKKEQHFFSFAQRDFERDDEALVLMADRYRELFAFKGMRLGGEISPSYFYFPGVAQKIHAFNSHLKIFCILRHPVDRALSDFYYAGLDKKVSIESFFVQGIRDLQRDELVLKPFSPSAILYKGFYRYHIARYVARFPSDQLLFLPFPLLQDDSKKFFKSLLSFLNVKLISVKSNIRENRAFYPSYAANDSVRSMLAELYLDEIAFYEKVVENSFNTYKLAKSCEY